MPKLDHPHPQALHHEVAIYCELRRKVGYHAAEEWRRSKECQRPKTLANLRVADATIGRVARGLWRYAGLWEILKDYEREMVDAALKASFERLNRRLVANDAGKRTANHGSRSRR